MQQLSQPHRGLVSCSRQFVVRRSSTGRCAVHRVCCLTASSTVPTRLASGAQSSAASCTSRKLGGAGIGGATGKVSPSLINSTLPADEVCEGLRAEEDDPVEGPAPAAPQANRSSNLHAGRTASALVIPRRY